MNTWFTVKVKYIKQLEDGRLKSVTEPYLVDAVNFTEAEKRIYEEVGQYSMGEGMAIKGIAKTDYADIFYYDDSDTWYKCKLTYVTIDGDEGKEKKINSNFLVTAANVKEAYDRIHESLSDMTVSFEVPSIMISPIVEVLPYDPSAASTEDEVYADPSEEQSEELVDVQEEESQVEDDEEDVTVIDESE